MKSTDFSLTGDDFTASSALVLIKIHDLQGMIFKFGIADEPKENIFVSLATMNR